MNWQELIILQTILVGFSTITIRILAKNKKTANSSFAINAILYVGLYISFLLILPAHGHVDSRALDQYWFRFLVGGFAFTLTNVFTYKTLVYFDAGLSSIAQTLNSLFTIVTASIILGENLSLLEFLGSIILVLSISYGILATHNRRKKHMVRSARLGLTYALLAGVTFAFAAVNEKSLLSHMSVGSYSIYGIGAQCLMSVIAALIIQPKQLIAALKPTIIGWSFLSGVIRGLGGLCFILAEVRSNNVALIAVISNFKMIIVIFLGWWLLKERQFLLRKFVSASFAISGLALMFIN